MIFLNKRKTSRTFELRKVFLCISHHFMIAFLHIVMYNIKGSVHRTGHIFPGVAQLVARLLWELEHQNGSTSQNVAYFPVIP